MYFLLLKYRLIDFNKVIFKKIRKKGSKILEVHSSHINYASLKNFMHENLGELPGKSPKIHFKIARLNSEKGTRESERKSGKKGRKGG